MHLARRILLPVTLTAVAAASAGCATTTTTTVTPNPAANTTAVSTPPASQQPSATHHPAKHNQAKRHSRTRAASARPGRAAAALNRLVVKGRAPKTGYTRERFGYGWASVRGCDVRDRMLARDLIGKTFVPGDDCAIQSGRLNDPYTATTIDYVRGGASEVDIDHVVALSDAWQKGAQRWSGVRRHVFANDPLNLLSVDAGANRAKGDGDAATWLPPNKRFRCTYVARQVAVKRRYGAWVTRAEHDAIARVLAKCPAKRLPRSGARRAW